MLNRNLKILLAISVGFFCEVSLFSPQEQTQTESRLNSSQTTSSFLKDGYNAKTTENEFFSETIYSLQKNPKGKKITEIRTLDDDELIIRINGKIPEVPSTDEEKQRQAELQNTLFDKINLKLTDALNRQKDPSLSDDEQARAKQESIQLNMLLRQALPGKQYGSKSLTKGGIIPTTKQNQSQTKQEKTPSPTPDEEAKNLTIDNLTKWVNDQASNNKKSLLDDFSEEINSNKENIVQNEEVTLDDLTRFTYDQESENPAPEEKTATTLKDLENDDNPKPKSPSTARHSSAKKSYILNLNSDLSQPKKPATDLSSSTKTTQTNQQKNGSSDSLSGARKRKLK